MNAACPTCGYHWGKNGPKDGQMPVPISDDTVDENGVPAVGVLHFCSPECRDKYKEEQ